MKRSRYASFYGPMITALGYFGSIPPLFIFGAENVWTRLLTALATVNVAIMLGMNIEESRWREAYPPKSKHRHRTS